MRYVIADKEKSKIAGFDLAGHKSRGSEVALNEKEVMDSQWLGGTLAERAAKIGGAVYTEREVLTKTSKWRYE